MVSEALVNTVCEADVFESKDNLENELDFAEVGNDQEKNFEEQRFPIGSIAS